MAIARDAYKFYTIFDGYNFNDMFLSIFSAISIRLNIFGWLFIVIITRGRTRKRKNGKMRSSRSKNSTKVEQMCVVEGNIPYICI